jgi:hypothetical protein
MLVMSTLQVLPENTKLRGSLRSLDRSQKSVVVDCVCTYLMPARVLTSVDALQDVTDSCSPYC